jgi:hypothetical protein
LGVYAVRKRRKEMFDVFATVLKCIGILGGCTILLAGAFAAVMLVLSPVFVIKEWFEVRKKEKGKRR